MKCCVQVKIKLSCNRPWRPIGLWDVEAPTFSRHWAQQMAVRLSALRADHHLPPGRFLLLISVRDWVDTRAIARLEGLGQLKNPVTPSGIEPATFRLVAWCLNQLRCGVPRNVVYVGLDFNLLQVRSFVEIIFMMISGEDDYLGCGDM
jgi:hypothetical protein